MLHDEFVERLGFDVSRESFEKLEAYHALLLKWQKAINLVSPKTLSSAWERHFLDSAQIVPFIPDSFQQVMDWGSGAGFAGAVLAILRPDLEITLVESDERKCQFLRTVSRETSTPIRIENKRIEAMVGECSNDDVLVCPSLITARALASVEALLDYAEPLLQRREGLQMVLLKGESVDAELEAASLRYGFDADLKPSITQSGAAILTLKNIIVRS